MPTVKYGTPKKESPSSATVLLWIGSAVATIIVALWVAITPNTIVRQHELERVSQGQTQIREHLSYLSNEIRDQTKLILDMKRVK